MAARRATFTFFRVPDDPKYLEALGLIAVRHAHLDRILQMTIKSLADVKPSEALRATAYQGSGVLRDRILKLAKARLGEGAPLVKLQAIIQRCGELTDRRNEYMHSICAQELDGPLKLIAIDKALPMPKASKLRTLANDLAAITTELNDARLGGWLLEALIARKKL